MDTTSLIGDTTIEKKTSLPDTTFLIGETTIKTKVNLSDTSNQYIYDFMKFVISSQNLDLSYGLTTIPEKGCNLSQDDKTFLNTLLIEKSEPIIDTGDWRNLTITLNLLPKCLTNEDIDEMLLQKMKLQNFTWDNSRLGFTSSNDKKWYCFSLPLFSKDKQKVVMMIRSLCPGLCGTGWTVVFTKQNNEWTSQTSLHWIH
jgi:hypothetical protein